MRHVARERPILPRQMSMPATSSCMSATRIDRGKAMSVLAQAPSAAHRRHEPARRKPMRPAIFITLALLGSGCASRQEAGAEVTAHA
jgi:hypothetical protein